jgi:uncharacterized protein (TIGR03435 family)
MMHAEGDVRLFAQAQPIANNQNAEALAEFKKAYALAAGEDVKRIGPPFPASRAIYYRNAFPGSGKQNLEPTASLLFLWQEDLSPPGLGSSNGSSLRHLLRVLLNIYPQEIEGDQQLLKSRFDGDFVAREGVAQDKLVAGLADLLRRDFKLPIKMSVREVERSVIVANGEYRFTPAPGGKQDAIEIYEKNLNADILGGGTGDLKTFVNWVGMYIDQRMVVGDVDGAPEQQILWQYHGFMATEELGNEPKDVAAVLKHVTKQTGLTFRRQKQKVRVVFVEKAE